MNRQYSLRSELYNAIFNGNGVARRLAAAVILFSSAFTLVFTAIQLYLGYSDDLAIIEKNFQVVEVSQVPSIVNNVWSEDEQQIQLQLDGLLQFPDVEYAAVVVDGAVRWSSGQKFIEQSLTRKFPLEFVHRNQLLAIGELDVRVDIGNLYGRVFNRLLEVLASNGVKTFFVAAFMLAMFQILVTRHLYTIANYAEKIDVNDRGMLDLELNRRQAPGREPDALDRVVQSVNLMRHKLTSSYDEVRLSQEGLKKALVGVEEANQAKSEFLATMSHELRTPLNAILGFSEILSEQYFGPPGEGKYREYAKDIHQSGEHLLELVNDLLDISTIEAGERPLVKKLLNISEILDDCSRIVGVKAQSKGIRIVTDIAKKTPSLYGDKRAVKQILLNLMWNAVKFTPDGGNISISAVETERFVVLAIEDTGIGIPADQLLEVTTPFTRGKSDPFITDAGWGLGLSITKLLVDLHDGMLDIKSEVGRGTVVTVSFPIEAAAVE